MNVRVIPTGVHGILDYVASGVNVVGPSLLRLDDVPRAALPLRISGMAGAGYALLTDYDPGFARLLPMPTHLAFDAMKGIVLASSPWLLGFADNGPRYWLPHILMGAIDLLGAILTEKA